MSRPIICLPWTGLCPCDCAMLKAAEAGPLVNYVVMCFPRIGGRCCHSQAASGISPLCRDRRARGRTTWCRGAGDGSHTAERIEQMEQDELGEAWRLWVVDVRDEKKDVSSEVRHH